ncbi:unnamed protein product [Lathyrus sativus]|nr:unnamed protein product [Lathyrus sativus]
MAATFIYNFKPGIEVPAPPPMVMPFRRATCGFKYVPTSLAAIDALMALRAEGLLRRSSMEKPFSSTETL